MRPSGWTASLTVVVVSLSLPATAAATFPGANGRVVFETTYLGWEGGPGPEYVLGQFDPVGGDAHELRRCSATSLICGSFSRPAVSPDGSRIAIRQGGAFPIGALAILNWDGVTLRTLPQVTEYDHYPSWSPDGQQLAFTGSTWQSGIPDRYGSYRVEIYVVNTDGTGLRQLTYRTGFLPTWASNGRIAFQRKKDIYLINASGRGLRRLTYRGGSVPSWSPNARRLAFTRWTGRQNDVFVVRADGRKLRRLTYRGGDRPVWSPDGHQILFERPWSALSPNAPPQLMTATVDRRGERATLTPPTFGYEPPWRASSYSADWQPLPTP